MRMKVCWGVFGVLIGLFVLTVTPLGGLIHLCGEFKSSVVPLGILGAALLILGGSNKNERTAEELLLGDRDFGGRLASQPRSPQCFDSFLPY